MLLTLAASARLALIHIYQAGWEYSASQEKIVVFSSASRASSRLLGNDLLACSSETVYKDLHHKDHNLQLPDRSSEFRPDLPST